MMAKENLAQDVSKPVSKTFIIVAVSVAAIVILAVLLIFSDQFIGKAIQSVPEEEPVQTITQPESAPLEESVERTQPEEEIIVAKTSEQTLQTSESLLTVLNQDDLLIELEVVDASTPEFWVNVYLTSTTHAQISNGIIGLFSSDIGVAVFTGAVEFHPHFNDFSLSKGSSGVYIQKFTGTSPVVITPGARIYLGRIKMENKRMKLSGNSFNLDLIKTAQMPDVLFGVGDYYNIKFTPYSVCVPRYSATGVCGFIDDGCGNFLQGGIICSEGYSCVNNNCQKSAVTPDPLCDSVNALQGKHNTLVTDVVDVYNNNPEGSFSLFIKAIQKWFASS